MTITAGRARPSSPWSSEGDLELGRTLSTSSMSGGGLTSDGGRVQRFMPQGPDEVALVAVAAEWFGACFVQKPHQPRPGRRFESKRTEISPRSGTAASSTTVRHARSVSRTSLTLRQRRGRMDRAGDGRSTSQRFRDVRTPFRHFRGVRNIDWPTFSQSFDLRRWDLALNHLRGLRLVVYRAPM